MRQVTAWLLGVLIAGAAGAAAQTTGPARTQALGWVDANARALAEVNKKIWTWAETGLEERRSSAELITLLESNGFAVEAGVADMPTAFVASYGSGRPIIGILAEYDALPGLSQEAAPSRTAREGVMAGHGCGHSIFGTASTGAAIAVKQAIERGAIRGTIRLYGTPAEETGIIAAGAAMMTRTTLAGVRVDSDMHEVLPSRTLSEVIQRNLELVGPPSFTDAEKAFARETQAALRGGRDVALSETIEPLPDGPGQGVASTDVGDISWFVPVGQLTAASYTFGAPGHSWQIVACTGMSIGEKGMMVAARALAGAAVDLFESPALITRARAELDALRATLPFVTLIPEGQRAPKVIR